jgi:hypothetical protein
MEAKQPTYVVTGILPDGPQSVRGGMTATILRDVLPVCTLPVSTALTAKSGSPMIHHEADYAGTWPSKIDHATLRTPGPFEPVVLASRGAGETLTGIHAVGTGDENVRSVLPDDFPHGATFFSDKDGIVHLKDVELKTDSFGHMHDVGHAAAAGQDLANFCKDTSKMKVPANSALLSYVKSHFSDAEFKETTIGAEKEPGVKITGVKKDEVSEHISKTLLSPYGHNVSFVGATDGFAQITMSSVDPGDHIPVKIDIDPTHPRITRHTGEVAKRFNHDGSIYDRHTASHAKKDDDSSDSEEDGSNSSSSDSEAEESSSKKKSKSSKKGSKKHK